MSVYVGYYAHLQNKLKLNLVQRAADVPRDLDSIAVSLFTNRETAMLSTETSCYLIFLVFSDAISNHDHCAQHQHRADQ